MIHKKTSVKDITKIIKRAFIQLAFFVLSQSIINTPQNNTPQKSVYLNKNELLLWEEKAVITEGSVICVSLDVEYI